MDRLKIPKLKGQALTIFLVEKVDEIADNICQDEEQLLEFVKKWHNGFHSYSFNNTILAWIQAGFYAISRVEILDRTWKTG